MPRAGVAVDWHVVEVPKAQRLEKGRYCLLRDRLRPSHQPAGLLPHACDRLVPALTPSKVTDLQRHRYKIEQRNKTRRRRANSRCTSPLQLQPASQPGQSQHVFGEVLPLEQVAQLLGDLLLIDDHSNLAASRLGLPGRGWRAQAQGQDGAGSRKAAGQDGIGTRRTRGGRIRGPSQRKLESRGVEPEPPAGRPPAAGQAAWLTRSGASKLMSSTMRSRMVCRRRAPMLSTDVLTSSATRAISRIAASAGGGKGAVGRRLGCRRTGRADAGAGGGRARGQGCRGQAAQGCKGAARQGAHTERRRERGLAPVKCSVTPSVPSSAACCLTMLPSGSVRIL